MVKPELAASMTPNSQGRRRVTSFVLAFAATVSIVLTPFVKFIALRDYGFAHPEVAIVFAYLCLAAFLMTVAASLRRATLRPILVGLLVLLFLYSEFKQVDPEPLSDWARWLGNERLAYGSAAAAFTAAALGGAWVLRRNLDAIVVVSFGVIMITTVLFPGRPPAPWEVRHGPAVATDKSLPPLLHIVLDQQIGIDGLPTDIADGATLRDDLRAFYANYGFTLFPRAFTHFPATVESISNLLNQKVTPEAVGTLASEDGAIFLRENAWFQDLADNGYAIDVYQSRYFDVCRTAGPSIATCSTYNQADVRFFHDLDVAPVEKAKVLLDYILNVDFGPILFKVSYFHHALRLTLGGLGLSLPEWDFKAISPSPLAAMDLLSRLSGRIESLGGGEAIFAYVLLPHDPFVYDRACELKKDVSSWSVRKGALWRFGIANSPARRRPRYRAYLEQVRCTHARLGEILDKMRARGILDRSVIVIHGDHGSMIGLHETYTSEPMKSPS